MIGILTPDLQFNQQFGISDFIYFRDHILQVGKVPRLCATSSYSRFLATENLMSAPSRACVVSHASFKKTHNMNRRLLSIIQI